MLPAILQGTSSASSTLTVAKSSWPYAIGVAEPVSVYVDCFGTNRIPEADIVDYILKEYDLTPRGIITALGLLDVDYNKVSSYGHFGKAGLPWEE